MSMSAPIPCMDWEAANLTEAWRKFEQHAQLFLAGPLSGKKETEKISFLLIWVGEKGRDIYNTWTLTADEKKLLQTYFEKFKAHVKPETNIVFARYKFHIRSQRAEETFDKFVTDLKLMVKDCEYDKPDEMVRDRIVIGVNSQKVREKLLEEGSQLTLQKSVTIAHNHELSQHQLKTMSEQTDLEVKQEVHSIRHSSRSFIKNCLFCGRGHPRKQCPAWGSDCENCGKKNHWKGQCEVASRYAQKDRPRSSSRHRDKSYRKDSKKGRRRNVRQVELNSDSDESDGESLTVRTVKHVNKLSEQLQAKLKVRNPKAKLIVQIDTGAEANILPTRCFRQLYPKFGDNPELCPDILPKPLTTLTAYNGAALKHHGLLRIDCCTNTPNTTWHQLDFYVCDTEGPVILGLSDSRALQLVSVNPIVQNVTVSVVAESSSFTKPKEVPIRNSSVLISMYPDRFEGLGKFPQPAKLQLKDDAEPVVHAPRRCPVHLKKDIQAAIDNMESLGIIERIPQGQPTEWLSNLAYARKSNGKLRVCLDPRDLNANIKRTYHRAPTVEEITYKLSDAKVFSKLDAKDGYWSIQLDEPSSLLTAFSSPSSNQRYKFKRLPFGINVSQDLFQESMDEITRDLDGVISIADDICVYGNDAEDHDRNLHNLMVKARAHGLVFNKSKCFIKVPEITFFGSVYSQNGVHPDPARIAEIQSLPPPASKQMLMSLLGMVQYLAPFLPHLSDMTAPLRELTKKDSEFLWTASHQQAFEKIKSAVAESTTLKFFNPKFQTRIQVDASKRGLGAALIQIDPANPTEERIIAFASKSLSDIESRYANIERELLAVVFGIEKFHTYVYGSKVIVESDHKPLETMLHKNLAQTPPRLQRMLLRLQPYDMEIQYRKGSELLLADFLSRYKPNRKEPHIHMDHTIHSVRWTDSRLDILRTATSNDPVLKDLLSVVRNGWPEQCSALPRKLHPFWTLRHYIGIEDGILIKGQQIIVPEAVQNEVLAQLHNHSHQGIEKTQALARRCACWPNINKDIAERVGSCTTCNTFKNSQPPEPMYVRDVPSAPWEILASDLFQCNGKTYLLVCDYFSKYFIVRQLTNETAMCVIKHLKSIFSEHGIPRLLYSDNGPCYSGQTFAKFAELYNFNHLTSSPHYPQSNGFAERMVGIVKKTMKKCADAGEDPELAFLFLRTTPVASNLPSPAELLFDRPIRSTLPSVTKYNHKDERTKEILQQRQEKQKQYFDVGTKSLTPLSPGAPVMLQSEKDLTWQPATVVTPTKEPRSYIVQDTTGTRYRRNRKFLREMPQSPVTPNISTGQKTNNYPPDNIPGEKCVTFNDSLERHTTANDNPKPRTSGRNTKAPQRLIEEL